MTRSLNQKRILCLLVTLLLTLACVGCAKKTQTDTGKVAIQLKVGS